MHKPILLSLVLLSAACNNNKTSAGPAPSASVSAATIASTAPSASAAPTSARPKGTQATLDQLKSVKLPGYDKVKTAKWTVSGFPLSQNGEMHAQLSEGKKYLFTLHILDCRSSDLDSYEGKPRSDLGDIEPCFFPGGQKVKGYATVQPNKDYRGVRAGNLALDIVKADDKIADADFDAFVNAFDFDSFAKL
jgi:hypothetical protein